MRKIISALAVAAVLAGVGIAAPASAAGDRGQVRDTSVKSLSFQFENGQICHNIEIVANGQVVVDDVGCGL